MEKNYFSRVMGLKSLQGFGNKKVLDILKVSNIEKIDSLLKGKVDLKEFDSIYEQYKKNGIKTISYFDKEYPIKLKKIDVPPVVLFAKGNIKFLNAPSISIVGTRHPTEETYNWTVNFAKKMSDNGYVIISGGAIGVDKAAHKGALIYGRATVCVLGSGINNPYPKENIDMINLISENGLVISEYLPDQNVREFSLVERNRITSGLGDAIIIVATGINGGSIWQFKNAHSQKKLVFCPNPKLNLNPNDGLIQLIKEGKVVPINEPSDVLTTLHKNKDLKIYV